jgi:hypothetical protein
MFISTGTSDVCGGATYHAQGKGKAQTEDDAIAHTGLERRVDHDEKAKSANPL